MKYKKIILTTVSAFTMAVLATNHLASAANLQQAVSTLPQNEEWSIMAYASVGQNVGQGFLAGPLNSSTATDYEKRILAITATGANPATIGSENFVSKLIAMFDGNQIGDQALINDDIFGVLALSSAGISDNVVSKSRQFILSHQNSDGGWGYGTGIASDSNMTAAAIAALAATGSAPANALNFLSRSQDSSGGYGFAPGQAADGASTAWVMWGLRAAGGAIPNSATDFLSGLQIPNGSFKWHPSDSGGSTLVTAYAVIALSGHTLPIKTIGYQTPYVTPYATPYSTPYPSPYGTPYATPYTTPYTTPYATPYQTPGTPYPYPTPTYPTPYATPYQTPGTGSQISISYPDNKIFTGSFPNTGSTVLAALIGTANQISLLYTIKQTALGQFVESIDGYRPVGSSGWQFAVNGTVPAVGAADYILHSGDIVQWFYGPPGSNPY